MKKLRLTVFLVIILAIIALILVLNNSRDTFSKSARDFAIQDTSSVTKVFMSDKSNKVITLQKDKSGLWIVNNDYKARKDAIITLLTTMMRVSVLEPVSKAARNNVIKRLAANSVKVEIYQRKYRINIFDWIKLFPHEKLTKTYYVGGNTQNNIGTYMLMEGSQIPFITYIPGFRGFISIRYSPREDDWRDHTIFNQKISEIRSVKVEFLESPEQSYVLKNEDNTSFELKSLYQDKEIQNYDTLKVLDFITSFSNIKFEALLNNLDIPGKDSIINSTPFHVITLTEKTGNESVVKTFHKYPAKEEFDLEGEPVLYDRDRLYALVNNDEDFVLIQFFVFDRILRPISYFMKSED